MRRKFLSACFKTRKAHLKQIEHHLISMVYSIFINKINIYFLYIAC